jgi:hypothetical protein
MKRITIIIACLLVSVSGAVAQDINTSFAQKMDSIFSGIDKNKVPYGILLDYGMELTNVPAFDGKLTDSTNVSMANLKQIYYTLLSSRIQNTATAGFVAPEEFNTRLQNSRTAGQITLTGLFFNYAAFDPDALAAGTVEYRDGVISDKYDGGVWLNPYTTKKVFAIAPAIPVYQGMDWNFIIPYELFYTNSMEEVKELYIDFDDENGFVPVDIDTKVAVSYKEEGVKTLVYKLVLQDNTHLYARSFIRIDQIMGTELFGGSSSNSMYYQNITAADAYLGQYGSVRLTIDDAGNDGIRKPLIVAEGFDLGTLFNPENVNGMNTYTLFRNSLEDSGDDLKSLIWNSNREYDIIYVDWHNGVDYLQRNAYALQAVINWVNNVKIGSEPNVVLGQSMGGVIARWALADMEERSMNHDTRLFISHDAPQQGANMPLSLQYFYRHATNQYITASSTLFGGIITIPIMENNFNASTYLSILDVPATRQLLKNWSQLDYSVNNSIHESFYAELKSKGVSGSGGYPIQSRNIAVSNGAECGTGQGFNPGDYLIKLNNKYSLSFLEDLASLVVFPIGGITLGLTVDGDFFGVGLLGLIPGSSSFTVDFQSKALHHNSTNMIYKGKISYTKKILWVAPVTINITNVQKSQPSSVKLPFDSYGGGYYDVGSLIDPDDLPNGVTVIDKFDFIPTVSALDIGNLNVNLNHNDYKMSYVGANPPVAPKDSPFNNFSTDFDPYNPNTHNKPHISFNTRNGDWLAKELNAQNVAYSDCSAFCSDNIIEGDDIVCNQAIYTIPNLFDNIFWSVYPLEAGSISSGQGTAQATFTANTSYNGFVTIKVQLYIEGCESKIISKQIWRGKPSNPIFTSGTTNVLPGSSIGYTASAFGATSFEWKLPGNFQIVGGYTTTDEWQLLSYQLDSAAITPFAGAVGKNGFVEVRAINNCGISDWVNMAVTVTGNGTGMTQEPFYNVFPNPATDLINIGLADENYSPGNGSIIKGDLFDFQGLFKGDVPIINNAGVLDVSSFPSGIYILRISIDGNYEGHQVIIQ